MLYFRGHVNNFSFQANLKSCLLLQQSQWWALFVTSIVHVASLSWHGAREQHERIHGMLQVPCWGNWIADGHTALLTSEVKQRKARSVLGRGAAWEDLRVLWAVAFLTRDCTRKRIQVFRSWGCV